MAIKILLVDDDPELTEVYSLKLKDAGYDVVCAENGKLGIEKAKAEKPDLIIMDVKMPIMNGIEAYHEIKEDRDLKYVKVVFLTAFSNPMHYGTDEALAKGMGALDFIPKETNLDEFLKRVERCLSEKK